MRVRSVFVIGCATAALSLSAVAPAAVAGEVITANDATTGGFVAMSAVDGSGLTAVACGGDLSHNGTPRYYLHRQKTGAVLPDGTDKHEIVAFDEDCALGMQLTSDAAQKYTLVRWTPDGRRLAWTGARFDLQSGVVLQQGIWVADVVRDLSGRPFTIVNVRMVLSLPKDSVGFSFAGDGRRVAFSLDSAGQWDVYVADLDLGLLTNITNTPGVSELYAAFSPAGEVVAFVKVTQLRGVTRTDVFLMSPSGGTQTQLTTKSNTNSSINITPAWSPDGASITFSGMPSGQPVRHIYRIAADGSGKAQNLTKNFPDSLAAPQWRH